MSGYSPNIKASFCFILFVAILCRAQSNALTENARSPALPKEWKTEQPKVPPEATNWGESIKGVRLFIAMTNSLVEVGSSIVGMSAITNSSTNAIQLHETGDATDFDITLTSATAKSYKLTPRLDVVYLNLTVTMNPREIIVRPLPIAFGTNIEPGHGQLLCACATGPRGYGGGMININEKQLRAVHLILLERNSPHAARIKEELEKPPVYKPTGQHGERLQPQFSLSLERSVVAQVGEDLQAAANADLERKIEGLLVTGLTLTWRDQ